MMDERERQHLAYRQRQWERAAALHRLRGYEEDARYADRRAAAIGRLKAKATREEATP